MIAPGSTTVVSGVSFAIEPFRVEMYGCLADPVDAAYEDELIHRHHAPSGRIAQHWPITSHS